LVETYAYYKNISDGSICQLNPPQPILDVGVESNMQRDLRCIDINGRVAKWMNRNQHRATKMVITPDTVIELLQQNEEFKRLLIDQNKQLIDTQEKIYQTQTDNIELHKQLMTALHTGKIVNNTIHNNTTNHHHNNQKFNLNFFEHHVQRRHQHVRVHRNN